MSLLGAGLMLAAACGGKALVDGVFVDGVLGDGGGGGTADVSSSGGTADVSSSSSGTNPIGSSTSAGMTTTTGDDPCVSCEQWLDACFANGPLCDDPDQICEGPSNEAYEEFAGCLCRVCGDVCSATCFGSGSDDRECTDCTVDAAFGTCGGELTNCQSN